MCRTASIALTGLVLAVAAVPLSGCATRAVAAPVTNVALKQVQNPRYLIVPGDEIEVKLAYHPQFNERMEVLPDGTISLPLLNEVTAAGKSPSVLAKELKAAYSRELQGPDVVVIVRRSNRAAFVGGEVRNPQPVPLAFPLTLLQAVIRCGDVLSSAHESNVLILRAVPNGAPQVLIVNLERVRSGKSADLTLEPNDIVYVPKTGIAKVGEFVENYINKIIPRAASVSFPFWYQLNRSP